MLYKTLSNIFQNKFENKFVREIMIALANVTMIILIVVALLMMDAKEIDFIYANF